MPIWVHVIRFSFFVFKLRNEWPFGYTHSSFIRNNAVFLWNHNFVRKVAFVWERRFNNSPKVLWVFFFFFLICYFAAPANFGSLPRGRPHSSSAHYCVYIKILLCNFLWYPDSFPTGYFFDGHFPKDISPLDSSPNAQFAEQTCSSHNCTFHFKNTKVIDMN